MGIVERIKGLIGGDGRRDGDAPPERPAKGDEELDIEAVQRDAERDRAKAYERLTDVDGRSD
jgi:hypothetical protein